MIKEEQRAAARCINVVYKKPHSTDGKSNADYLKVRTRILELEKTSCSINLHLPFLSVSDEILRTHLKTKLVLWQLVVECSYIFSEVRFPYLDFCNCLCICISILYFRQISEKTFESKLFLWPFFCWVFL